jgi:hypothetical protein
MLNNSIILIARGNKSNFLHYYFLRFVKTYRCSEGEKESLRPASVHTCNKKISFICYSNLNKAKTSAVFWLITPFRPGLWSRYTKAPTPTPRVLKLPTPTPGFLKLRLRLLHKRSICINNGKFLATT